MTVGLIVYCADVGSIPKGNFGWARSEQSGDLELHHGSTEIAELVEAVAADLRAGTPVALGFECPLFVPVPEEAMLLGTRRNGEPIAFSASAGAGALVTGLVQVAWALREIRQRVGAVDVFQEWAAFTAASHGLFLWEALVSGAAKAESHVDDAAAAVACFRAALPDPSGRNGVAVEGDVLSLLGAALLWAGWPVAPTQLRAKCLVLTAPAAVGTKGI